jgi:hypothetical protein
MQRIIGSEVCFSLKEFYLYLKMDDFKNSCSLYISQKCPLSVNIKRNILKYFQQYKLNGAECKFTVVTIPTVQSEGATEITEGKTSRNNT